MPKVTPKEKSDWALLTFVTKKIKLNGSGWNYVHIGLCWWSKEIVGYSFSFQSKTEEWLDALHMAINNRFPNGILESNDKPKLVSDNGCQPTSERYMKTCSDLKIKQIFTTWNNPKGNADTERVIRTIFPHQSLNDYTPQQFMNSYQRKEEPIPQKISLISA